MSAWLELLLLALASMFWPTLIVIVVLALRVSRPVKILAWFLAGGLLTTIAIGTAVVFALQDASFLTGSKPTINPVLDITIGLLSLLGGLVLMRRSSVAPELAPEREPVAPESAADGKAAKPSISQRAVESGAPVAFVSGVVLNIIPGTFPILALKNIAQLDAGNGAKFATIVVFYLIMFAFVEVPIIAYSFAPERTTLAVNDFNAWLGRNGRRVAGYVLVAIGIYLIVHGVVDAIRS